MKKYIIVFLFFIFALFNNVFASEYIIRPAIFDQSGSILFLPVKTSSQINISDNIKITRIEDSNGVDIEVMSSSYNIQPEDIFFSDGYLKEFHLSKEGLSTKIRLILKDKYNPAWLKVGSINNNILITFSQIQPYNMNYYVNTYRQDSSGIKEYFEGNIISSKTISDSDLKTVSQTESKSMNEINNAFSKNVNTNKEILTNYIVKDINSAATMKSKYYIADAKIKDSLFSISGAGTISIIEPFELEKPNRIVYDLPNTIINHGLHNKELSLQNGDILRIAQFNKNTARIVVTSKQAHQYIPVYSADSQGVILTNPKNLLTTHLPSYKTNIVKFTYQKIGDFNNFLFEFDKPLTYSIKRNQDYLYLYFLNAEKYNDASFHSAIKDTPYSDLSIHLLSTGMRLKLPLKTKENISTYISPDGKVFKIMSEVKKVEDVKPKTEKETKALIKKEGVITPSPQYTSDKNSNVIVIDAGHGGKDCGAIRNNIYEKTITLDVSMKLKSILQKKGYKVYMTRTDDTFVSLEDRTIYTENINPAVFVSVHVNSCNSESPKGIETHYYHDNSIELADYVHKNLMKKHPLATNRGLFKSRFYVINHTSVPAILVEIGFISNDAERAELLTQKRQQSTAEGIAEGIIEYLKSGK